MKLSKKRLFLVSFMLFSLFFGAGNLIFPSYLGVEAGKNMPLAMLGFVIPAVILPVLGVIIVAKFGGLEKLARKVHPIFAVVFTLTILLSIGPGLGIPRAASVPFEMVIKDYLVGSFATDKIATMTRLFMLIYSLIFFAIALWLALSPTKLVDRIGHYITPVLLSLIVIIFGAFIFKGAVNIGFPRPTYGGNAMLSYKTLPFLTGFSDGYQTMDTIAALNFGLVIATTLFTMGFKENKDIVRSTVKAGLIAGSILTLVYVMLAYMGMASSNVYPEVTNGAELLRKIVAQVFGEAGAIIVSLVFTLACLTTCVGLITSISQYFSDKFPKFSYRTYAIVITVFSFLICNNGLEKILDISIPVLNAIYPVSIVLILLGLFDRLYKNNKVIYPLSIALTAVASILYVIHTFNLKMGFIDTFLGYLPGYELGFGWVWFFLVALLISLPFCFIKPKDEEPKEEVLETIN